ncbi:MAG: D-alanyl-D-alanine carboxypeptidase/D-alanyl-D-alanine-endopeptidase [Elusimicrobia bacterium]|nr:D-alanyl-D-alanine carboxypeptidase/D-alanyl-D-alanine-endopeptidase [Elusimicrobiota bacterium]
MRKLLLFFLSVNLSAAGSYAESLKDRVENIAESDNFKNAQWGISVKYADTGEEILSYNSEKSLVPGSTVKLFVSFAALEFFGEEHSFATDIFRDKSVDNGILNGNIYLRGGGDPSLGSDLVRGSLKTEEVFEQWLAALKQAGIKEIRGSVLADDSLFEGKPVSGDWSWEDLGNYYAAGPSGLSINDNLYKLYFKPSETVGGKAEVLRMEPEIYGLKFINFMRTGPPGSGDNGYIFNFPDNYTAVLRGTIPQNGPEFAIKGSIPEPALFCAAYFTEYLKKNGTPVKGAAGRVSDKTDYGAKMPIHENQSPALKDLIFVLHKRSFNLYAETLLRHMAVFKNRAGTIENGIDVLTQFLKSKGIAGSGFRIVDACGLSRLNLAKASDFSGLLLYAAKKEYFSSFYDSLVFPGDPDATGHIRIFGADTPLEKVLRVKSGSLNKVRSYCGYLKTKKGRLAAFAFIVNNFSAAPSEIEKEHERILTRIAGEF